MLFVGVVGVVGVVCVILVGFNRFINDCIVGVVGFKGHCIVQVVTGFNVVCPVHVVHVEIVVVGVEATLLPPPPHHANHTVGLVGATYGTIRVTFQVRAICHLK